MSNSHTQSGPSMASLRPIGPEPSAAAAATSPAGHLPLPSIPGLPPSAPPVSKDFALPLPPTASSLPIPAVSTAAKPASSASASTSTSNSPSAGGSAPKRKRSGSLGKPSTPRSGAAIAHSSGGTERKTAGSASRGQAQGHGPTSEMKRQKAKATFTTCRSYPENAPAPILPDITTAGADLQRSQRRSKVQAISKLDRAGTPIPSSAQAGPSGTSFLPNKGSSVAADTGPGPSRNPLHRPPIVNPPFRMEEVRNAVPRHTQSRSGSRLFGLQECPVFYPTPAEFADPLAYIATLPASAKEAGICKVVPPSDWKMPFSLESDTFRFKTRLQRLNSLEAASRAKVNFLEQLTMFHLQQGDRRVTIPLIDKKPLDLWRLRKEVTKLGGYEDVTAAQGWARVSEILGHDPGWGNEIQIAYKRIVHPFDTLSIRAKTASVSPLTPLPASKGQKPPGWQSATPASPSRPGRMGMAGSSRMGGVKRRSSRSPPAHRPPPLDLSATVPNSTPKPVTEHLLSAPIDLNIIPATSPQTPGAQDPTASGSKVRIPGFFSGDGTESDLSDDSLTPPPPVRRSSREEQYQKGEVCEVCRKGNHADKILLCDGCDRGFHIFCLDPPLSAVPANEEWFCTPCLLSQGDDYGFEEGEDHSIASFAARDAAFSGAWWNKHRPSSASRRASVSGSVSPTASRHTMPDPLSRTFGRTVVSEDDVEREFWRLTESNTDTLEVEYGADVHSTTHGSAAPTLETHPLDPYSKDGWNLNNMPILPDSLLRYIKSDISGMTVPWIYIGMMFSAFCWHNEDHYTYSINYMYWGETKTWYGIPGADAEKFETAIKAEAPELFEQQPSLLYQLVTMMNPGRLIEQDVRVLACDQRPNEFVITFPKAYHCGFNHGINFNEAVNFALPDWLPDGKESVVTYRNHAKPPVFSHHELLISITLYSDTIKTALWVQDSLARMVTEETARRERVRTDIPLLVETLVEEDCPEEGYQCVVCKGFCYLTQMTCSCTKAVSCLDHADQLCKCAKSKRVMRKRYSEAQLEEILAVVQGRAALPGIWRERFMAVLSVPRPPLKTLRGLLTDGERIPYPMPEVDDLRALVGRANAWVEKASALGTRKSAGRRRKGQAAAEEDDVNRSPEHLAALLAEVDRLAFDAPEIPQLRQMFNSIQSFKHETRLIFSTPEPDLDYERTKTTLILGQGLQIDLPEISRLEKIIARLEWYRKVEDEVDDRTLQYADVVKLLQQAKACEIPDADQLVQELRDREERGRGWKLAAEKLLDARSIELADVDALVDGQELTPTSLDMMLQLEGVRKTALNWQTTAQALLTGNGTAIGAARLCKSVNAAQGPVGRVNIPEITDLQAELRFHDDWLDGLGLLIFEKQGTKVGPRLVHMLAEMRLHLDPNDNEPNDVHTCFCRGPAGAVMMTCETCLGKYHPKCLSIPVKNAATSVKCLMCSRLAYDDRPSLHALALYSDTTKWNFILQPTELGTLRSILELAIDYSKRIIPLLTPYTPSDPPPDIAIITHFARKLFSMPIAFDAVHTKTNERVIFEDWLFKRMREARQLPPMPSPPPTSAPLVSKNQSKGNRSRKPRLILAESKEKEFSCICKEPPVDQLLQVKCTRCEQGYHLSCVLAPLECAGAGPLGQSTGVNQVASNTAGQGDKDKGQGVNSQGGSQGQAQEEGKKLAWRCPCCCVREGKFYLKGVELRVQDAEHEGTNVFIDYRATVSTFHDQPVYTTLPAARCILLHCTEFVPAFVPDKPEREDIKPNGIHETDSEGRPRKKVKVGEDMTNSRIDWPQLPTHSEPAEQGTSIGAQDPEGQTTEELRAPPQTATMLEPQAPVVSGPAAKPYRPTDVYRPPATAPVVTPTPAAIPSRPAQTLLTANWLGGGFGPQHSLPRSTAVVKQRYRMPVLLSPYQAARAFGLPTPARSVLTPAGRSPTDMVSSSWRPPPASTPANAATPAAVPPSNAVTPLATVASGPQVSIWSSAPHLSDMSTATPVPTRPSPPSDAQPVATNPARRSPPLATPVSSYAPSRPTDSFSPAKPNSSGNTTLPA